MKRLVAFACAALALAGNGYQVALVEPRSTRFDEVASEEFDLRVSAISPRSREILQHLDVPECGKCKECAKKQYSQDNIFRTR